MMSFLKELNRRDNSLKVQNQTPKTLNKTLTLIKHGKKEVFKKQEKKVLFKEEAKSLICYFIKSGIVSSQFIFPSLERGVTILDTNEFNE